MSSLNSTVDHGMTDLSIASRVRCNEVIGTYKPVAQGKIVSILGLVRNLDNMTFGEQKKFWSDMNRKSRTDIVNELDVNLRKIHYNGNRHEFQTLTKNFKIHSKEMDKHKREIIMIMLEKYLHKIQAQALINFGLDFSQLDNMCQNGSLSKLVSDLKMSHEINVPIIEKISSMIENVSSSNLRRNLIMMVLFLLKCKFATVDVYDVIMLFTAVGVLDVLTCSIVDLARYVLYSFQRTDARVLAQASVDDVFIENIFMTVVHFAKGIILPTATGSKDFSCRSKKIFEIWRAVKSVDEMIKALIAFFEIAQDKITKYLYGYSQKDRQMFGMLPGLEKWYQKVNDMYLQEGNFAVTISPDAAVAAKTCYSEGLEYYKTLRSLRCPHDVFSVFLTTFGMAKELFTHAQSLNCTSKTRVPPLVVHFYGGAGVGKSTLCQYVIGDVAKEAGFKEYSNDLIYIRDVQQEFWDGYCGQFTTIYDDIFQSDDATKRGLEAIELVRANNTMQMPLHMADISQKGNMCFSSKMILLTSNPPRERCIGISTGDAFWRRRDFVFKVKPNEKYCRVIGEGHETKLRVDSHKVFQETGKKYSTEIYRFTLEDVETGDVIKDNLSYDEMITLVKTGYTIKYSDSCELIKQVEERFYAQGITSYVSRFYLPHADTDTFYDAVEGTKTFVAGQTQILMDWIRGLTTLNEKYPILKWLSFATSLVSIFVTLWNLVGKEKVNAEYNVSGDSKTQQRHIKMRVRGEYNISGDATTKNKHVKYKIVGEGSPDPNCFAFVNNCLWRNCVKITVNGNNGSISMRGIFVKGKIMVAPNHMMSFNDENYGVDLDSVYGCFKDIPFDELKVFSNVDADVCAIEFPKYIVDYPDISKHFVTASDFKRANITQALLFKYEGTKSSGGMIHRIDKLCKTGKQRYDLLCSTGDKPCYILEGLKYETFTEAGMCGSPLVVMNVSCHRKIIGFHVAGSTHYGHSNILTSEIVEKLCSNFQTQIVVLEPMMDEPDDTEMSLRAEGNVNVIGMVKRSMGSYSPPNTKIEKSPIHGLITKPTTAPAILDRYGKIDPMIAGVKKYMDDPIMLNTEDLKTCQDCIQRDLNTLSFLEHRKTVLSVYEALNGVEGDKYMPNMNWNTSVGYPYTKMNLPGNGKHKLVYEVEPDKYMPSKLLQDDIAYRLQNAIIGIVVPTIWVDSLKDERRSLAKVQACKTRVFCNGPMDYTVLFRQYFLGFTAHAMDNRHSLECQVGINPHSYEWTELYNKLDEVGEDDTWIAGDFSAYDGVLPAQVIDMVCELVNDWYDDSEENKTVRRVLFSSVKNAYHLCGRSIYRCNHGNTSGNAMTSFINSFGNSGMSRYIFIQIGRKYSVDIALYRTHVRSVNYGDDNLFHVDPSIDWFNMETISQEFKKIGITYTPAQKDNEITPFIDVSEVTFLKRRFVWSSKINAFLAPLEWESITEMFNWIRKGQDSIDALLANVRSALYELFHYGPDTYKTFKNKVDKVLMSKNIRPFDDTWYHYYSLWSQGVEDVNCARISYTM